MFNTSTSDRLSRWKEFRAYIDTLPLHDAIEKTDKFWQICPFIPYYLEPNDPSTWPDPWQLISENYYCDLAKVLGIVYTLHLSKHSTVLNPEIHIYFHQKTRYDYHIAYFCHGKYVLNLVDDEIVNNKHINQNFKLKHRYTAVELQLEKY